MSTDPNKPHVNYDGSTSWYKDDKEKGVMYHYHSRMLPGAGPPMIVESCYAWHLGRPSSKPREKAYEKA